MPAAFSPAAVTFLRRLKRNNDRPWFVAHRAAYDRDVLAPMLDLVASVGEAMRAFAPEYVPADPKRVLYRLHRDTRFAKDKTPFKTHLGAQFQHPTIAKNRGAGFYFHVGADEFEVAGGLYLPGPDELLAVRRAFVEDEPTIRGILADRALRRLFGDARGDAAKRPPRAFEAATSAADLVARRQLYFGVELPADTATSPTLKREVVERFRVVAPLVGWLNAAVLAAQREAVGDATPARPEPMF